MPRKKTQSQSKKANKEKLDKEKLSKEKISKEEINSEKEITESIENEEQSIEIYNNIEDDTELNIDSLSDLEDLDSFDDYKDVEEDIFISEDDLVICPSCGEIIEIERLRLLEECPNCGLHISEFEEIEKYDQIYKEKEEDEDW